MKTILFKNKKTGKTVECNVVIDKHLINSLEKNKDYRQLTEL